MGGFQTYDKFLEKDPIQKMPKEIAEQIREYIENNRVKGDINHNSVRYLLSVIHQ